MHVRLADTPIRPQVSVGRGDEAVPGEVRSTRQRGAGVEQVRDAPVPEVVLSETPGALGLEHAQKSATTPRAIEERRCRKPARSAAPGELSELHFAH